MVANSDLKFKRILVVKLADFGDALLVEPALRALHNTYPAARLDVLTTKSGLPALERLPYLHQVMLLDKYRFDKPGTTFEPTSLSLGLALGWQLLRARYDVVIFFHHLTTRWGALKFAGLALATLAPLRAGLDNHTGRAWFLNHTLPDGGFGEAGISEREYWLRLANTLGGASEPQARAEAERPQFVINQAERQYADNQLEQLRATHPDAPIVMLYPGSGPYSLSRRWLPLRFAQVGDALFEKWGAQIVILGSQAEVEVAAQIQSLMHHPATILAGRTTLYQAGALLARCNLFIGNDGGLMNLAAAMGAPTIAIFGPTNAQAWQPFGLARGKSIIVQAEANLPCRPCLYRGKELGKRYGCAPRPCLTQISAEEVIAAANRLLQNGAKLNLIKSVE